MRYAIVVPVKNEEENLPYILQSIVGQTLPPQACLILDDGSTDNTKHIVEDYMARFPQLVYHHNSMDGGYILGAKIVKLFTLGAEHLKNMGYEFDYIIKLDADIKFHPTFMEEIKAKIGTTKYGIVSGTPYVVENGNKIPEFSPLWHTHGQFKIYSVKCLAEMGGIPLDLGWDCADNIIAIEKGWETAAFRDIFFEMTRPIGRFSALKGRTRQGMGAFKLRFSVWYVMFKGLHDIAKPPLVIGSFYYFKGFLKAAIYPTGYTLTKAQGKLARRLFWKSMGERVASGNFRLFQSIKGKR